MNQTVIRNGIAGVILAMSATVAMADNAKSLKEAVADRFLIGAAIMSHSLDDTNRAKLLAGQFNQVTCENQMKPASLHPQPDQWNFAPADRIVKFALENNMQVVGHTLLWHTQCPGWMFEDSNGKPLSREEGLKNLKTHIDGVLTHYKGKVIGWDVVNEAISDAGNEYLRPTPALKCIGEDYIVKAFEYARECDPSVQLYYNDYNIEMPGKREKTIKLLKQLQAAGVKIDGVGIQGHWSLRHLPIKELEDTIAEFDKLGLKVMLTELDIDVLPRTRTGADVSSTESGANPYVDGCPDNVLKQQADAYHRVFETVLKYPKQITRVTFWNLTDKESWLNNFPVRGRTNYPLLFDRDCNPKPAFGAVIDVLKK